MQKFDLFMCVKKRVRTRDQPHSTEYDTNICIYEHTLRQAGRSYGQNARNTSPRPHSSRTARTKISFRVRRRRRSQSSFCLFTLVALPSTVVAREDCTVRARERALIRVFLQLWCVRALSRQSFFFFFLPISPAFFHSLK